jgi:RNA polymerase sigma-70 factor (ECF subfamily)
MQIDAILQVMPQIRNLRVYGRNADNAMEYKIEMEKKYPQLSINIFDNAKDAVIDAGVDLESDFAQKLNDNIVHDSVNSMDEPTRSVFILRYFYYEKVNDIARRLGITPKTVENHLYRGKGKLKWELQERGIQYE